MKRRLEVIGELIGSLQENNTNDEKAEQKSTFLLDEMIKSEMITEGILLQPY